MRWAVGAMRGLDRHARTLGGQLDEAHRGLGHLGEIEHLFGQLELARLDLRHVEDAVDQLQQMIARLVDQPRIFQIARSAERAEHLVRHHFGEADDGVERRAQFVAHIGEEARLGAVGLFGEIARLDQFALVGLALGDVAGDGDDVGGLAVGLGHRAAADLRPDMACRRRASSALRRKRPREIARLHEGRLHRLQIVGMHQGGGRQPEQCLGLRSRTACARRDWRSGCARRRNAA